MTLAVAVPELTALGASPRCVVHLPCDWCSVCQRRRCCRRDNPLYELPHEGEWQPFVGQLGVLSTDGDRVECHVCGGYYAALGRHVVMAHDLLADEYRALFGLKASTGLIGPRLASIRRRWALELALASRGDNSALAAITAEQRSQINKAPRSREERDDRANPERYLAQRENAAPRSAAWRAANPERYLAQKARARARYAAESPEDREKRNARRRTPEFREKQNAQRRADPEQREKKRAYDAAHREEIAARRRAFYYAADRPAHSERATDAGA